MRLLRSKVTVLFTFFFIAGYCHAESAKDIADKAIKDNNIEWAIENIKKATGERLKNFSAGGNKWGNFLRDHGHGDLALNYARRLFNQEQKDGKLSHWDWKPLVTALISSKIYDELDDVYEIVFQKDSPSHGKEYAYFLIKTFNNHERAEKILKKCVSLADRNKTLSAYNRLWSYENLANYYGDYGRQKEQESILRDIENKFPNVKKAYLYIAEKYSNLKKFKKANKLYTSLITKYNDKNIIKAYADMLVQNGDISSALSMLEREIQKNSKNSDKIDLLVKSLSISTNYTEPLNIQDITKKLNFALTLSPKKWNAVQLLKIINYIGKQNPSEKSFIQIGKQLYKNDCWNNCYSTYAQYLSNVGEPELSLAILSEGESDLSSQNYKKQMWKQSLQVAAENRLLDDFSKLEKSVEEYSSYDSYYELARVNEIFLDRFNAASKYYSKAFDIASSDKQRNDAIFAIAKVKTKSGDLKGAEKFIVDYFKKSTSKENLYKHLSYFYRVYLKDRDKALKVLEKGLQTTTELSKKVDILRRMAKAYLIRIDPKPQEAITLYKKALDISDDTAIYADLALTYNNYTDNKTQRDYYMNIILKRKPKKNSYKLWYATDLAEKGLRKEALKVLYSIPSNKRSKYNLACIYAHLGEKDLALKYLEDDFRINYSKKGKHERNEHRLWMIADNDLRSLRENKTFQKLAALEK